MTFLMPCREGSSLLTAMKHVVVLVLLPIAGLVVNLMTASTVSICLCSTNTKAVICLCFFGPGLAFLALAVSLQKRKKCFNTKSTLQGLEKAYFWKNIFMSIYPSLYWVAILMLDGRYYSCYSSQCNRKPEERGYYDHDPTINQLSAQSQLIGFVLILVLALLVLLYLCCERCCRPVAWRLEEQCELALHKEREECAGRFALAFAKHKVAQQEVHLYETPLQQDPNKTLISGPAAPGGIPRSLTAKDVFDTINHQPINTIYS
ncbi:hypothetical protein AAFF_G00406700 [Aldrovandia affinis]|uniref:Uncharacterized protein n=1 Tax=Aldrovandia affinis TaxID=143900 RepID=A0AAD7SCE7_9TELE|nr:hypothetical protein AAFF_G00406700 [Aldrovandia affinis]